GKQRRKHSERRHKPAEEDDATAESLKQILAELETRLAKANVGAKAKQNGKTVFSADPVPDAVTDGGAGCRRKNDRANVELMRRAGINGGGNQHGFTGQRNARAFQHDDEEDRPVAVQGDYVKDRNLGQNRAFPCGGWRGTTRSNARPGTALEKNPFSGRSDVVSIGRVLAFL